MTISRIATLCFLLYSICCQSQQIRSVSINDSVRLQAGNFRGQLQWQSSTNNIDWTDVPNQTQALLKLKVTSLPIHYRSRIIEQSCAPLFSEVVTLQQSSTLLWSDPATWNGVKPSAGQTVTIPEGSTILLDENPPALAGINILGKLEFARQDLNLSATYIMIHGTLEIGTEAQPFAQKAIITLTGNNVNENNMDMGTRGIMVMGGTLELHGATPVKHWTKLNAHAAKNTTTLHVEEAPGWSAGDEIVIAPTDFYLAGAGTSVSQRVTLTQVTGNQLTIGTPLNAFRWGLLQYATSNGISLTSTDMMAPPIPDTPEKKTPTILDERAEVAHLTRRIVIQAPADDLWNTQGFGVHIMVMGPQSTAHVEGVEIKRGGQRGRLARYAFHCHQMSYSGTQTLPDATGQYIRNSVINSSANRGIVLHGTNGVLVKDNIIYDVRGHGIFTEDAVERRNTFDGNIVLLVRNSSQPLKVHESFDENEGGSSGFWISNPDNIIRNNIAADCIGNGFWLPFPSKPFGLNGNVLDTRDGLLLNPSRLLFGVFDNNTAHSNGMNGIILDDVEIDNAGNTFPLQYISTANGRNPVWPNPHQRRFTLSNYKVWKNLDNGIWDRASWPDNYGTVSADNCGRFYAGSGSDGMIEQSLVVGTSLNHMMNGTGRPANADFSAGHSASDPTAFATYHSTFDIRNNIVINFPAAVGKRSGVFATDDYYTRPLEKGQMRNVNNTLIASHPGVRLVSPSNWFTLASVLWDYHGVWGAAQNYIVYDTPFLTYGKTPGAIAASTGAVSVPGPFFGFNDFVLHGVGDTPPMNQPYFDLMGIHVKRYNTDMNEVGTWSVQAATAGLLLQHMRHFAASPDGIYELTFPQETASPTDFQMTVEGMLTSNDMVVMGIQFDGTKNAVVRMNSANALEIYQPVNSLSEVRSSNGATFWQDKPNNRVWMKIRGGHWRFWTTNPNEAVPTSDDLLYEPTLLQIKGQ